MATPNPRHIDSLVRKTTDRIFGLMKDYSHRDLGRSLAAQSHRFPITLKKPNAWGQTKGTVEVNVYRVEDLLREKAPGITAKKRVYVSGLMVDGTKLVLGIALPTDFGPSYYEDLYMKMIDTLKHEVEHWYQIPIGRPGSLQKGYTKGKQETEGGSPEYFLQPIEVEAHVAGLYLQAKKMRKPARKHMAEALNDSQERYGFSDADKRKIYTAWMKELKMRYPRANPLPNPIDKRLDFVRKQYGQETYEKTREIVAANLGIAEADIAPGMRVDWEKFIPWLGKQVHRLLKQGPRAAPELKRLETGFLASIEPFMVKKKALVLKEGKVVKRRPEFERLSPKRARQFAGRQQRAMGEAKGEQAKKLGYKEVARLGNGYTAVVAVIDPKAPSPTKYMRGPEAFYKKSPLQEWTERHAPFQQWLGVELRNCLQFYTVNCPGHGLQQFRIQRAGGKLYGVLDPTGKPVAAIVTNPDGSIRETNGPGNRPPPEKDQEYVDRFIQKHLKQSVKDTAFHPPGGFPPQVTGLIEDWMDYWSDKDLQGRRRFLRKAQGYARQQGADFSKVWPQFAIYILEKSRHSVLASARSVNFPNKSDVISVIKRVIDLYKRNGSSHHFEKASKTANAKVTEASREVKKRSETHQELARQSEELSGDAWLAWKKKVDEEFKKSIIAIDVTRVGEHAAYAAERAAGAGRDVDGERWTIDDIMMSAATAASEVTETAAITIDAKGIAGGIGLKIEADHQQKLLELMRDAARAAGGAQPRQGNPTGARGLIKECQRLWEHYCERPNKTRLRAVAKHCEAMKKSKAATVARERRNCTRCVRAEARARKWDI